MGAEKGAMQMRHWENIWSFKTAQFRVDFDVTDEDDLDLSWDDDGSTREGLESGEYVAFVARVQVTYAGRVVGSDYLGNCIYESPQQFRKQMDGYFPDMVRVAVAEARKDLCASRPYLRRA